MVRWCLFGQVALNPTIERISDKNERGRVLNEAWGRFNVVNFASMAAALLTWRLGGLKDDAELRAPALMLLKNLLLGGAAVSGIASGILGARIASPQRSAIGQHKKPRAGYDGAVCGK